MKINKKNIALTVFGVLLLTPHPAVAGEYDDACKVQRLHTQRWQSFALRRPVPEHVERGTGWHDRDNDRCVCLDG